MTQRAFHVREPVYSGGRRVRGLWQYARVDGSIAYEARLRIGGRDRRVLLEARTKSDAIREAEAVRVDRDRGEPRHRSLLPTLAELADEWIDHLQARVGLSDERRRYSQGTVDLYRQRLRDHVLDQLGFRRVDEVTTDDVRRIIDRLIGRGLAPGTVTSCLNITSGLFRYALKRRLIAHNPVRDLDRDDRPGAARQTEPRYLDPADAQRLLAELTDTFRPVAAVCVYAGLRISEALGLRWRDLDFKAGTITVDGQLGRDGARIDTTKTSASRATVPMLPVVRRELVAHRKRQADYGLARLHADALVFTTARGEPQSRRNALRAVHRAGDAVGLNGEGQQPVGLHDLRHTLVSVAFASSLSAPEVSSLARHANARVTLQVYAGLTDGGLERASKKLADGGFGV
jgi:integrase